MTRRESLQLTARVLAHLGGNTLDIAAGVWFESREEFVGRPRFEADRRMFRRSAHVIGWVGEAAEPGDFTTKDVMSIPVLVVRGKDRVLRAFINGCAHRGAQVAVECGTARRFTCPYHGWTYSLDGRLQGAPARHTFDGADLGNRGLVPLPVCERAGLITVGLDHDINPDSALLEEAADELAQHDFASHVHFETRRFDLQANWKLVTDVNFEGYHFPYAHANTIDAFVTNNSVIDTFGRHARWAFPFRDIGQFASRPETEWPDQFHGTVVYGLFPSCVVIESPGLAQMLRIYPGATPGETVAYLTYGSTTPVLEEHRQMHADGMEAACMVLRDEDFPAAEACQRGIEAGVEQVVFGRNEPLLHHFASAWQQALLDQEPISVS